MLKACLTNFISSALKGALKALSGLFPPFKESLIQWLGNSYESKGLYYQKDKLGDRSGEVLLGSYLDMNGTDNVLSFDDLTGVTITDSVGTSVLAISGNDITATAGTIEYLELSNGAKFWFDEKDGQDIFDISGLGFHGTIGGTLTAVRQEDVNIYSYNNELGYNEGGISNIEEVTNGDFDTDTGWNKLGVDSFISGGQATIIGTVDGDGYYQNIPSNAGSTYIVEFDILSQTSGNITDFTVKVLNSTQNLIGGTVGKQQITVVSTGTFDNIRFISNNGNIIVIDNVSIKEVYPATVKIPANQSNLNLDAIDNTLLNKGQVGYDAQLVESSVGVFNATNTGIDTLKTLLPATGDFKFTATIKSTDTSTLRGLISQYYGGTDGRFQLFIQTYGAIRLFIGNVEGNIDISGGKVLVDEITTIELERIGNDFTIKQDGVIVASINSDVNILQGVSTKLFVNDSGGAPQWFSGTAYSVELQDKFKYNFGEGSGSTLYDITGNENHGTLVGTLTSFWDVDNYQRPNNLFDGFTQGLICNTADNISIVSEKAYGVWEIDFNAKGGDSTFYFINSTSTAYPAISASYWVNFLANGKLEFYKFVSVLMSTSTSYFDPNGNYRVRITREENGAFTFYIKGESFGTSYVKIVASTGSNPVIDNTFTSSNYSNFNFLSVGTQVSNYKQGDIIAKEIYLGLVSGDSTIASHLGQDAISTILNSEGYVTSNIAVPGDTIDQQLSDWSALTNKDTYDYVIVEIGLNDLDPSDPTSSAIARLQNYINTIRADVKTECKIIISSMLLAHQRLIDVYGAVDGETSYQKELDINESIMGGGSTPITSVDYRNDYHVSILSDANGDLKVEYDMGDHVHPNNAGRTIIADGMAIGLTSLGIIPDDGILNITNLTNIPLFNFSYSANVDKLYLPVDPTGTGEALTNPGIGETGSGHNGAETKYLQPVALDLITLERKFADQYSFDISNIPTAYSYDKITYNRELLGYEFADVSSKSPLKFNMVKYSTEITDADDLAKVYKFIKFNI